MPKGDGVKNESVEERKQRMRGIVIAPPDSDKNIMYAPTPDKIQNLLHNRGNPVCFETEEDLEREVNKYFQSLISPILDENGAIIGSRWVGKPTVAGLANFLGCSRQTVWEYSTKSDGRAYIIKNAKNLIAEYAENAMLNGGNPAAYINYLLNLRMETPWIADEKTIKVEPVLTNNEAKTVDEIASFLDDKSLPPAETQE